jgi:serine/threonine-protein kinase
MLGTLKLSDEEFLGICQKLAAGLGTAHTLGAIHRDIAPDNILLADGDPARPKIIDFGIAKDAREQSGTIVGDGFAGKLRYVAPEQLGEYGRNIGPWTDMYSLALTLRAVVAGKPSDMGGSMADAVRKRMHVPDLSDIPAPFRAAFEAALQPDPARRPQSMAAFNVMLTSGAVAAGVASDLGAGGFGGTTQLIPGTAPAAGAGPGDKLRGALPKGDGKNRLPLMIGGGAAALIGIVGVVIATSLGGDSDTPEPSEPAAANQAAAPAAAPPVAAPGTPEFAALVSQASANIGCSWLSLVDAGSGAARFSGTAAVPASAQTQLGQALAGAGAKVPTIDFANVLALPESNCTTIDALRAARGGTVKIATPQTNYEMRTEAIDRADGPSEPTAHAKVRLQVNGASPNFALVLLSNLAAPQVLSGEKTRELVRLYKGTEAPGTFAVTLPFGDVKASENAGIAVISSDQPLPANITTYDAGWPQRFLEGAKAGRWKADAVWFRVEDRQPG